MKKKKKKKNYDSHLAVAFTVVNLQCLLNSSSNFENNNYSVTFFSW